MKVWVCTVCGWIYDEAKGDPDYDLAPGVPFADLPDDFVCPLCGVGKDMFEGTGLTVQSGTKEGEPLIPLFFYPIPCRFASVMPSISDWNRTS